MEFTVGLICGALSVGWIMLMLRVFRPHREITDWTEEAYRRNQPRAITRVHAIDLDWEIK